MNKYVIKQSLQEKGYVIIPDVLTETERIHSVELFNQWKDKITNLESTHNKIDPHGIFKFHEVGHQEWSWLIRTTPKIVKIFKDLWECNDLAVSFDGTCWIPKNCCKQDNIWTHTDQAPNSKGLSCYQGFVSLTSNKERTLRVYEGSHLLHSDYFDERNIKSSKNWQLIDKEYLKTIDKYKRHLVVPAGALVLWDSRVFHQNRYGKPNSEERIVQYVCYLPKQNVKYTQSQQDKKQRYFNERRTTSHWPYPIRVNSLQPQTWGNDSYKIKYENLTKPNLDYLKEEINKLI